MTVVYLVQHGEKHMGARDPGLSDLGRTQALRTAAWFRNKGLGALYSSPMLRARQTAEYIATATGLGIEEDGRLRERTNWDGTQSLDTFLADWARSAIDRDFVPASGDSSRQAGQRLRAFLVDHMHDPVAIVVVTHGGVTVDLLRTLLGDDAVPSHLMERGVPPCAITTMDDLTVREVASKAHLGSADRT